MATVLFSVLGSLLVGLTIAKDGWFAGGQVYFCIGMLRYIITSWQFLEDIVQAAKQNFLDNRRKHPDAVMPSHGMSHLLAMAYIVALWWNIGEEKKLP